MKKLLLFSIISIIGMSSLFAQRNITPELKKLTYKKLALQVDELAVQGFMPVLLNPSNLKKTGKGVDAIPFSSSANAYTMLAGKHLTADQTSGRILFVHRGGGPYGNTLNDIKCKMTPDWGLTYDSVVYTSTAKKRYPGGTFFRKDGGSSLRLALSGPVTSGTGWISNYLYSVKIDGTESADTIINNPASTYVYHINDIIALGNGKLYDLGIRLYITPTDTLRDGVYIHRGNWNNTDKKFNYTTPYHLTHLFSKLQPPVQPTGHAWAKDGSVGYVWFNGMDSLGVRPNKSTQPMVYKSTDGGQSWNMMTAFDYGSVPEIRNYVWHVLADTSICRPVFFYGYTISDADMPGVVDANGNLHLAVTIQGGYSNKDDSLGYTFTYEPTKIFDLYTTSTGWDAKYIDTLASDVDDGTNGTWKTFSLDHRLHMARSDDGNVIFTIWTDTDPSYNTMNIFPNIKAFGHNITTNETTLSKNFTAGTAYEGIALYMTASDIALKEGTTYKIPVTYVYSPLNTPDSVLIHYLMTGIQFDAIDFGPNAGISVTGNTISSVSQNYPNPFSGLTNIDVFMTKQENLSVEVYNMMGQKVFEKSYGILTPGNHRLTVNLNAGKGIYLYRVKAGDSFYTNKMTLQ